MAAVSGSGAGYRAPVEIEVVINCGAGSVDGDAADAEQERIAAAFAPLGIEPRVRTVNGMSVGLAVRSAADRGPDVVVVAGGDGTFGTAADALADTEIPLGILPMGTFNHFAKDLGIPIELEAAAAVAVHGRTTAVDVAEVNGRTFVNNSSIGLYPVMVDLRDDIRTSRGWGKVRSVPLASWRVLRRFPTRRLHIDVDGQRWDRRTPFVFVGNNTYEVGPRGIGARTEIAEGVLCCYVAKAETRRLPVAAGRASTSSPSGRDSG
jgi:diacylglycerol kinase family enzyme